ncbi:hypothetical protein EW146_g7214 [Bondarzewia mesenterica]|uniref:Glucose-methanol-choline oxidoreductase N-terminal domain-containing protein n=1 Tax=Bondarzewia mesenterica TaxID=1095465 RepID=A0A4S4LLF1_9AGAM|nr:hypothetical protein EW146_g7214 [Bondarzewia mesenterica]
MPCNLRRSTFFSLFLLPVILARPNGIISDPRAFVAEPFDVLIVGGGVSGLVIAARLSEVPTLRVGVLDAGTYRPNDTLLTVPAQFGVAIGNTTYDWSFLSTPQPYLGGRVIPEPAGKVLGGSSELSAMVWQRGAAEEYDAWANDFENGKEWSFESLLPYFKKSEDWVPPPLVLPGQKTSDALALSHGLNGSLPIGYNNFYPPVIAAGVTAANTLGVPTNSDPDSGNSADFSVAARSVDPATGLRSTATSAYLAPILSRENLLVLTGAQVTKVGFTQEEGGELTADCVHFVASEGNQWSGYVKAEKEIILAAGPLKTPQILELSGVGNKKLLQSLGIETVIDLPGVGENLQDPTLTASDFIAKPGVLTLDQLRFNTTFAAEQQMQFVTNHTGALTYNTADVSMSPLQAFLSNGELKNLTIALHASLANSSYPILLAKKQDEVLMRWITEGKVPWTEFAVTPSGGAASMPEGNTSYISILTINLHPFGRGSVHINSTDPFASPLIDPKYFANAFDVAVHALGTAWARKWMDTEPISDMIAQLHSPPANMTEFDGYVRQSVISTFHQVGSTALAPRALGGVVDPELRVYNTTNLRVIGAGVFPQVIAAAPQSTVYAIAEKAADLIKKALNV